MSSLTVCGQDDDAQKTRLDSLTKLCIDHFSTPQGQRIADQLVEECRAAGNFHLEVWAYTQKAGGYCNMCLYDRMFQFCDSVAIFTNAQQDEVSLYYYMVYLRSQAYLVMGKCRLSISLASEMYESAQQLMVDKDDEKTYAKGASIFCYAIRNLSQAYNYIGQRQKAIDYLDEGIVTCRELKSMIGERMDLLLCKAAVMYEFCNSAPESVADFCDDYERQMAEYEKAGEGSYYESYVKQQIAVHKFSIAHLRTRVAVRMGRLVEAGHLVSEAKQLYAESRLLKQYPSGYYDVLAFYYQSMGDNGLAMDYLDSALVSSAAEQDVETQLVCLRRKLDANHALGFYEADYDLAKRVISLSDSLTELRTEASIGEMGEMLGLDVAQREKVRLQAQRTSFFLGGVIVVLMILGAFGVYVVIDGRKQKEKLNLEVARQTNELRQKNKDITDSIAYANKLQTAMLPDLNNIGRLYGIRSYALIKPYDVVSGDFYWAHPSKDKLLLACVDCTGHGVPGALMSMAAFTLLNDVADENPHADLGYMLSLLDSRLLAAFSSRSDDDHVHMDGMELALLRYDEESHTLEFASAHRPLLLLRDGVFYEYRALRRAIGDRELLFRRKQFSSVPIQIEPGDYVFMFSDGITDQFGGASDSCPQGNRLLESGLKDMLLQATQLPWDEQKDDLERRLDLWRGQCVQVDDISLVAISF